MKLFIKNMACESCKVVVKNALEELDIIPIKVELGEVETNETISIDEKAQLNNKLKKVGLELLEKKNGILIEKIRQVIIDYVNHAHEKPSIKFSAYLSKELNYSYSYLANFFSEIEATTIEQYLISLKIEKIKEMILFQEHSLSEIAYKLNYSSVAHLSAQFKKATGLTPTHFKKLKEKRKSIQEL